MLCVYRVMHIASVSVSVEIQCSPLSVKYHTSGWGRGKGGPEALSSNPVWYGERRLLVHRRVCSKLFKFAALVRQLAGASKGASAAMGVPPLMILCSIISLAFSLLSSSDDQPSLCSISVTLLRLRKSRRSEPHVAALLPI